ncbi:MAG: PhoH family protein [Gammaproteobacteria bacterium]|nr:PhoH family protein [Gammaproteobacteria bacterium]MCP5136736.1 PhoH family protein [Gammaproteobacteria bacterium]
MTTRPQAVAFSLAPEDNRRLAALCGPAGENLRQIEARLGVEIIQRGADFSVIGVDEFSLAAADVLKGLYAETELGPLDAQAVHVALQQAALADRDVVSEPDVVVQTKRGPVKPRGANQQRYIQRVQSHDLNFGIGPAGTGKTYLAVACAVEALMRDQVRRILLVRPAVEAGEKLGFLPGDLSQKIDPYLRPLYDALYDMLGFEKVARLIERNVIEVAPLAYMRGRTLNESFIILDEAQNTTTEQMKMFLTRIGFGSTVVVTGDVTQVDLPRDKRSGLREAIELLTDVEGISFTFFHARDVVRHVLVQRIVAAYDRKSSGKAGGTNGA